MSEEEEVEEVDVEVSGEEGEVPAGEQAAPVEESIEAEAVSDEGGDSAEEVTETVEEGAEPEASAPEAEGDGSPDSGKADSDLPPGADLEPIPVEQPPELDAEERARLEAEEEERAEREAVPSDEDEGSDTEGAPAPVALKGDDRYTATGKRKRSVARVTILAGKGAITVNERAVEEYFPRARHRTVVNSPLVVTGYESNVDVRIRVHGGGISGQAGAVRHGIARALTEVDPNLRSELKRRGFLTRDARAKERRKAGLKKARKRPQFSKR